ncbi:MAG: sugar ABC transporter substrate-binding protein, partial [Gammaproteobacteria bacterium]
MITSEERIMGVRDTSHKAGRGRLPVVLLALLAFALSALAWGCGDSDDEGAAKEPASGKVKQGLKLAFFSAAGNNTYVKAGMKGAEEAAARYGAEIQVFDAQFDAAKQLNQVMGAVASGDFDGFVLEPNDPQQLCSAAEATLDAGIVLAVTNVPVCDAPYDGAYPGTVIFVGGQSPDVYTEWFKQGFDSADGGKFAVLNGPAVHGNTTRAREVLDALKPEYPGWKEVAFDFTDYQPSIGLAKTENILNKHPDVDVIFSSGTTQTSGAIAAVEAAGKAGKIRIYDLGGNEQAFEMLKGGKIESTQIFLPYEEQYRAVQSVVAKLSGRSELDGVPTDASFWDLCQDPKLKGLAC